jgi:hypothetical protein
MFSHFITKFDNIFDNILWGTFKLGNPFLKEVYNPFMSLQNLDRLFRLFFCFLDNIRMILTSSSTVCRRIGFLISFNISIAFCELNSLTSSILINSILKSQCSAFNLWTNFDIGSLKFILYSKLVSYSISVSPIMIVKYMKQITIDRV